MCMSSLLGTVTLKPEFTDFTQDQQNNMQNDIKPAIITNYSCYRASPHQHNIGIEEFVDNKEHPEMVEENAMSTSRLVTVVVVCVTMTCSYIFGEMYVRLHCRIQCRVHSYAILCYVDLMQK